MTVEDVHALPAGYQLNHYRIENVIGRGGFGITYQAQDTVLRKTVAIKEYLPVEFAVRVSDSSVQPRSRRVEQDYRWGLERFLDEARTLARFRHPNLVPVMVFFEANGTAYMVMEFERGHSLGELLASEADRHRLIERLPGLLEGILSALTEVHGAGFLHRDIKPANIILHADGSPVLVDFGSARHAMGQRSRSLTSIVTPRYAPIEQYALEGRQGPWSDLYGLAAVLHHIIVGEAPPEAVSRVRDDPYRPLLGRSDIGLPRRLLEAIDRSLAVHAEQRPQSIAAFRALAAGTAPVVEPAAEGPPDTENAPTRILTSDAGRLVATASPERARAAAAAAPRSQDGLLRALRHEDRIRPPPPVRRGGSMGALMLGIAALLVGGAAGLYFTDNLPFVSHRPTQVATAPVPPVVVATPPAVTPPPVQTPTPPSTTTPPVVRPPVVTNPRPPVTNPTPPTPSTPVAPVQTPSTPAVTPADSGKTIPQILASGEPAADAAAKLREAKERERVKLDAEQAAQAARQNADRAREAAQRAASRAGAARIKAAEADKADLQGAERVTYSDGSVYVGQLANDRRNGLGVVTRPDGERQSGEWVDDKLNGVAVLALPDGRRYEGEWRGGVREGLGVTVLGPDASVAGEHGGNELRGFAIWRESGGRERAGQWQGQVLSGPAVEIFGGDRYEGDFAAGARSGRGVLVRTDGGRHYGTFANGRREGYGVETRPDGTQSFGEWQSDSLVRRDRG